MTGCAQFNKALGQQQATIYFQTTTPVAFKLKVRSACDNLPHVKATPIATGVPLASAVDVVTYNTTGAGVADIARLEECVNKFSPQVQGVNVTDSSDDSLFCGGGAPLHTPAWEGFAPAYPLREDSHKPLAPALWLG